MSDQWTDRLSEYLDGELPADERARLDAHLQGCADCTATLIELKRVTVRARALTDRQPQSDLWPAIAERIGATPPSGVPAIRGRIGRRWSFSMPELAAAGIALMVLSGGAAWWLHPGAGSMAMANVPSPIPTVAPVNVTTRKATGSYDTAVSDLERVLTEGRGRLDTATVRVIERNLAAIDSAIAQAQRAVAADSANIYLNSHLAEIRRRKLELLRQAANLVTAVS
jgi:hypothetical protein